MTPTSTIIERLKASGELENPKSLEAPAPKIDAVVAKPLEAKPADTKTAESGAAESEVVGAKTETRPAQAAEATPGKRRVIRKRETDEQRAQRIAAKYGVYW